MENLNKNKNDFADDFKNALFINYGGLGDEILFLPAIEDFKKHYPNSKITLCLEGRAKGIKQLTNLIDETIEVDIKASGVKKYLNVLNMILNVRKQKFDVVISSGKSSLVSVILYLTGIKRRSGYLTKTSALLTDGVLLDENQYAGNMYHDLVLPFIEDEEAYGDRVFVPHLSFEGEISLDKNVAETLKNGFIGLHPGVSKMSIDKGIFKCPDVSFWLNIIKGVLNKGEKLVLLGGPDDEDIIRKIVSDNEISKHPNFINLYGKTKNLKDLMGVMSLAKKLICADSAPLHIAVGLNKYTIAVFGPTNEVKLVPKADNIKVVLNKEIDCRPCLWHKRGANCSQSQCLNIKPSDVLELV